MLTQEQKMAVYNDYLDRRNKVADIADKYCITRSQVARIAVEMGATPRCEKKFGKKNVKTSTAARTCPKCRRNINVNGARFCCFCGSDIRTQKQICVEGLRRLMTNITHLPYSVQDEFQRVIGITIKELNE